MGAKVDTLAARLAMTQHGIVTRRQLASLGMGRKAFENRVARGLLHRVHRGVYAWGHPGLSQHGRWMAAVKACGDGAALSHRSAAALWGFLRPFRGPIHVTSPSRSGKASKRGIALHRSPSLTQKGMVIIRDRIPVTVPRRTIEDLPGTVEARLVRTAKRQAELRGYQLGLPTDRSRSDLESDFLAFVSRHGFPRPVVNAKVGKYTVDFLWPEAMLAVETDFFDYHRGSVAFEEDRQRDLELRRLGWSVRRLTGAQIRDYPDLVVADLREVLGGSS